VGGKDNLFSFLDYLCKHLLHENLCFRMQTDLWFFDHDDAPGRTPEELGDDGQNLFGAVTCQRYV
jgi:hypothetical protein